MAVIAILNFDSWPQFCRGWWIETFISHKTNGFGSNLAYNCWI